MYLTLKHVCHSQVPNGNHSRDTPIWKGFKRLIPTVLYATRCALGDGRLVRFGMTNGWIFGGCAMSYQLCFLMLRTVFALLLHSSLITLGLFSFIQICLKRLASNCFVCRRFCWEYNRPLSTRTIVSPLSITRKWVPPTFIVYSVSEGWPVCFSNGFGTQSFLSNIETSCGCHSRVDWILGDNMVKKKWSSIAAHADCDVCPAIESFGHLVLRCIHTSAVWDRFDLTDAACDSTDLLDFMHRAHLRWPVSCKLHILVAACAVTLWHARNDRVFNHKCLPIQGCTRPSCYHFGVTEQDAQRIKLQSWFGCKCYWPSLVLPPFQNRWLNFVLTSVQS
jgi:hypothetical protein